MDSLGWARGAVVSSGVGDAFAGVRSGVSSSSGVGFGAGDFFFFAGGCFAGFGLCRGEADFSGVAVGTVRIRSRAFRKSWRFSSSVRSAARGGPARPPKRRRRQIANCQPLMERKRIRTTVLSGRLRLTLRSGGALRGALTFAAQDGV